MMEDHNDRQTTFMGCCCVCDLISKCLHLSLDFLYTVVVIHLFSFCQLMSNSNSSPEKEGFE